MIALRHLSQTLRHLTGVEPMTGSSPAPLAVTMANHRDLSEVRGHETAKRALEIAAAGGHNLLLVGPPGGGKTMLARRLPGLLPPLTLAESIEITKIYSLVSEEPQPGLLQVRPFRSPHTGTSIAGFLGADHLHPRPGEATLAHHGVLFLDQLPEFSRSTLAALHQPLKEGVITSIRHKGLRFPARFSLLAAMTPCPCGHLGDPRYACTRSPSFIRRYRERISGPLLDRIDLHIEVPTLHLNELRSSPGETTADVARRVAAARSLQVERFGPTLTPYNAAMTPEEIRRFCAIDSTGRSLLEAAFTQLNLSAAASDGLLKVARTIADLSGSTVIRPAHLAEAIQYRGLDRRIGT